MLASNLDVRCSRPFADGLICSTFAAIATVAKCRSKTAMQPQCDYRKAAGLQRESHRPTSGSPLIHASQTTTFHDQRIGTRPEPTDAPRSRLDVKRRREVVNPSLDKPMTQKGRMSASRRCVSGWAIEGDEGSQEGGDDRRPDRPTRRPGHAAAEWKWRWTVKASCSCEERKSRRTAWTMADQMRPRRRILPAPWSFYLNDAKERRFPTCCDV